MAARALRVEPLPDESVCLYKWFVAGRFHLQSASQGWRAAEVVSRAPLEPPPMVAGPVARNSSRPEPGRLILPNATLDNVMRQLRPAQDFDLGLLHAACIAAERLGRWPGFLCSDLEGNGAFLFYVSQHPCAGCAVAEEPCIMLTVGRHEHRCLRCQFKNVRRQACTGPCNGGARHAAEVEAMQTLYRDWRWQRWHDLKFNRPSVVLRALQDQRALELEMLEADG